MSSNINPFNIDGTFPVAGQDNASQGFRDNFTNIRNNLVYAKNEMEDLQSKAILKSGLTGTTLNNDMGESVLSNLILQGYGETLYDQGSMSGAATLDLSNGNVQKITTGGAVTLGFANWPTSGTFGKIVLWISVSSTAHTLSFPLAYPLDASPTFNGVAYGLTDLAGYSSGTITFDVTGDYMLEFSTTNANTVMIRDLSRNNNVRQYTPASATAVGTKGQIAMDSSYVYACVATNTWKRMAITTW